MSEGNFELGKPGYYTPVSVAENDFLNEKLENTDYGIYYSVRFSGDAETYLWQSKTEPVPHERYWGHIEKSKSGKSLRFKKDKEESESSSGSKAAYQPKNNDTITLSMVWKTVAGIRGLPENDEEFAKFFEIVDSHFKELVMMGEKIKSEE